MKLTNKLNLPQPLVAAVANDGYTKGDADISVTELLLPPMLRALKVKHEEEIEEDVSDRIFSLLGQTIHGILERSEKTAIAERRLSIQVEGWKISGSMDRFARQDSLLQDYKLTTIYKTKGNKLPEEWVKQLNIYAEILRQNNEKVEKLEIVAIYRDWSKGGAERDADHPQRQVEVFSVPLIPSEEVMEFIKKQVLLHQDAGRGNYLPCTKKERWAKDDVWAVMKKGAARAVKLCYDSESAKSMVDMLGTNHHIEFREGKSTRCDSYCNVSKFCKYYQETLKKEK